MGAQSSLLTLVGAAGIGANKVAEGFGKIEGANLKGNPVDDGIRRGYAAQISEANDADKNAMMAEKARLNAYKLKTQKMKAQTERRQARLESMKSKEEMRTYKDTLKKEVSNNGKE